MNWATANRNGYVRVGEPAQQAKELVVQAWVPIPRTYVKGQVWLYASRTPRHSAIGGRKSLFVRQPNSRVSERSYPKWVSRRMIKQDTQHPPASTRAYAPACRHAHRSHTYCKHTQKEGSWLDLSGHWWGRWEDDGSWAGSESPQYSVSNSLPMGLVSGLRAVSEHH